MVLASISPAFSKRDLSANLIVSFESLLPKLAMMFSPEFKKESAANWTVVFEYIGLVNINPATIRAGIEARAIAPENISPAFLLKVIRGKLAKFTMCLSMGKSEISMEGLIEVLSVSGAIKEEGGVEGFRNLFFISFTLSSWSIRAFCF